MSRINRLTPEQEAQIPIWRDKWLAYGLSIEPADRKGAEKGVAAAYASAGLKSPTLFIWLRSPLEGAIGAALLGAQVGAQVWTQVWDQVWDQVGAQVRDQVRDQVRAQVRDQVWAQVGAQVKAQVRDQVWTQVWAQVWAQVGAQVRDQVRAQVCFGQHDSSWLGWADYFRAVVNVACVDRLSGLIQTAQCCGWWWPYAGAVILTEHPCRLLRDRHGRLHNPNDHAITYPDGWGIYAIHGVILPAKYILSPAESIDPTDILGEPNAQVRMAVISKVGFARMLSKLPHKTISSSPNQRSLKRKNQLLEFDLGNGVLVRGLHVWWNEKSGEEKENIIPVWRTKEQFGDDCPDNINDCEQVRRWVMRVPKDAEIVSEI